jgi:hypothetical protein
VVLIFLGTLIYEKNQSFKTAECGNNFWFFTAEAQRIKTEKNG